MEVEAKFSLPDSSMLPRFQVTTRLAGFPLARGQTQEIHDTYVDTAGGKMLAAGYACRFRQDAEGVVATLKSLGGVSGAIHRRKEVSFVLPAIQPLEDWPVSPLRKQVLRLASGEPLIPLAEVQQTRFIRPVHKQGQVIAELFLDDVHASAGGRNQAYYALEVELTPQGSEDDLGIIAACLEKKWGLLPETLSKLERALTLVDLKSGMVPVQIKAALIRIAERDDWQGLRARALLGLQEGLPTKEVSRKFIRSERTIQRWEAEFHRMGLEIFPRISLVSTAPLPPRGKAQISHGLQPAVLKPVVKPSPPAPKLLEKPGLVPDDRMTEVVRKTFFFHFQQMLLHEPGTRLGENIEELHDMRVATRRMRAALEVFDDYIDSEKFASFGKGLRRTGRLLGDVRDLDVFWEKTQRYVETLPPERKDELGTLQTVWQAASDQARERLLAYLDSDRYTQFRESFGEFLETPAAVAPADLSAEEQPMPVSLRQVAPVILYQQLAAVRAFDKWVIGPNVPLTRLHQLRITSKGLRYTLEFLVEVLGPEARLLIKELKNLQDHLGDLQDALVASNILRDFLTWGTWGHPHAKAALSLPQTLVVSPGVASYLAARQTELQQLPITFIPLWEHVQGAEFKQNFIAALAVL